MRDAQGIEQVAFMVAHKDNKSGRNTFRCTCDVEGFNGLCVWCHVRDQEDGTKWAKRALQVQEMEFLFVAGWDPSLYTLSTGDNGKDRYNIWQPRRKGIDLPEGTVVGGARFFRMGVGHRASFTRYCGNLEDVCTCVAKTGDPDLSLCTAEQALCPECGCVIFDCDDLDAEGTATQIRDVIFNELHPCLSEDDDGCWDEEKVLDDHPGYMLKPVYACLNHEENENSCDGPTPCDPFMKPALVTRTGEDRETTYAWKRDDSLSWAEWQNFEVPAEALEAFKEEFDFSQKLKILSLEEQAKHLGVPFPFEAAARAYGKEYEKDSNVSTTTKEDPRSKRRANRRNRK